MVWPRVLDLLVHNVNVNNPKGNDLLECVRTSGHVEESDEQEASGVISHVTGGRWVGSG